MKTFTQEPSIRSDKKRVLTLSELQALIPECKTLEDVNFKNLSQLLTTIIDTIEQSEKWEFVQYLSSNPSLFIIKSVHINHTCVKDSDLNNTKEINKQYGSNLENTSMAIKYTPIEQNNEENNINITKDTSSNKENKIIFPSVSAIPWKTQ